MEYISKYIIMFMWKVVIFEKNKSDVNIEMYYNFLVFCIFEGKMIMLRVIKKVGVR